MTPGQTIGSLLLGVSGLGAIIAAEVNPGGFDYGPLANIGAVGVVLAWLMWRVEPRLKALEGAIDRNTRATLLLMVEIPAIAEAIKKEAGKIIDETDEAERKREGK